MERYVLGVGTVPQQILGNNHWGILLSFSAGPTTTPASLLNHQKSSGGKFLREICPSWPIGSSESSFSKTFGLAREVLPHNSSIYQRVWFRFRGQIILLASPHPGGSEYRATSAKIITTIRRDVLSKSLCSATSSAGEGGSKEDSQKSKSTQFHLSAPCTSGLWI